jgi:steroid 5-alpha reductase family enzyme
VIDRGALFALVAVVLLVTLWGIQQRTRNAATADLGWAILVAFGAFLAGMTIDAPSERRLLVGGGAVVWAVRLGWHLLRDRGWPGRPEDGRYRALRERWKAAAGGRFLLLYLAQGPVAALFVVPIVGAMQGGALDRWAVLGAGIWAAAVGGEWLADRQLAAFRADPATAGTVCQRGLWRYSRHPNYFFEWLHWWAYVAIGHAAPATWIGPLAMWLFLMRVTGIPYTERQALAGRGDGYRRYQRTTNRFFPWWPRPDTAGGVP